MAIPASSRPVAALGRSRGNVGALSDEALLSGLAVGDDRAGAAFMRRFRRRVYGLALSMVSDPTLAEDIAQEALLRAWRHAPVFDPRKGSVATWVLAITRNLAIDAIRLRRAVPLDPAAMLAIAPEAAESGPDEAAMRADASARLRRAVAALPPDQRRALVLAAFHGRTAEEISVAEGIPLGTAKTRIRSAMGKLRAALVEERGSL